VHLPNPFIKAENPDLTKLLKQLSNTLSNTVFSGNDPLKYVLLGMQKAVFLAKEAKVKKKLPKCNNIHLKRSFTEDKGCQML